jgi:hypothetical protein
MRKIGDIVLVKSPAGDAIPHIHVKLLKRVVVKPSKGTKIDWPGYSGWEATPAFQEEIDALWKEWNIPLRNAGEDQTFVYDDCIIKKPRNPQANVKNKARNKRRIVKKKP